MIYYIDDFLPQDQFDALADRVKKGFRGDKSLLVAEGVEPVRVTHHDHSGDWEEGCNFMGQECRPAIKKMIATMEGLGIKELKNWSYLNLVGEELFSAQIMGHALARPFEELFANANISRYKISQQIDQQGYPYGYNLLTKELVETIQDGLLDSAKSVRAILWNSITIICTLIASE